jgi:hypothetical protein
VPTGLCGGHAGELALGVGSVRVIQCMMWGM